MKITVPFVKNQKRWKGYGWCGPIALASLLRYWKNKSLIGEIVKISGASKKYGAAPRGLAFVCLTKGFKVEYLNGYAKVRLNRKEYSKRFRVFLKEVKEMETDEIYRKKCERFETYKFIKTRPTLKLLENYIKQKRPALLYFNVGVVCGNDKFWPHYVTVVGVDKKNFYVHNIYPKNQAYQKIPKQIFAKAWNSDGMEQTLIVPYK